MDVQLANSLIMELVTTIQLVKVDILGFQILASQYLAVLALNMHQAVHAVKPQFINVHQELIGMDIDVFQSLKLAQSVWFGTISAVVFPMVLNVLMVLI